MKLERDDVGAKWTVVQHILNICWILPYVSMYLHGLGTEKGCIPVAGSLGRNPEMVPFIMLDQVTSGASTLVRIIASRRIPKIWNGVLVILV